jgi:hypothetical protein
MCTYRSVPLAIHTPVCDFLFPEFGLHYAESFLSPSRMTTFFLSIPFDAAVWAKHLRI